MSMKSVLGVSALFLCMSHSALATVAEPNALVVPIDSTLPPHSNREVQIYNVLQMRDSALDWQRDSNTKPEVFSPLCSFTAELILKETASRLGIGWYNVNMSTNTPPPYNEIYEIIPANATVPTKVTGQSIKDDPRYLGGLIGFALMKGNSTDSHYSERRLNINCSGCSTPGPWITSITYISKTLPNTFFLGFEDGTLTSTNWSNDGDFNDYVFEFTGLTCPGGGQPCTVPNAKGICSVGVTECGITMNTCKQVIQPESDEKCDGLDNNCDGEIDNGAVCAGGQICDKGHCVGSCSSEFPCSTGLTCEDGRCVNNDCAGVTCDGGKSCRGGTCVDACSGIVCPGTQVCRVGRCVEACNGVTCSNGQVCKGGACVPGCDCYPCSDTSQKCSSVTNLCVEASCADVRCAAGEVCKGGACVPGCEGAICPEGQTCLMGECYDIQSNTRPIPETPEGGGSYVEGCSCRLGGTQDTPGLLAVSAAALMLSVTLFRRRRRAAA